MNKVKTSLTKVKNHVMTHKFAYTMTVVAIATTYGSVKNSREISKFLIEKGINPAEFYLSPEDYEEYLEVI